MFLHQPGRLHFPVGPLALAALLSALVACETPPDSQTDPGTDPAVVPCAGADLTEEFEPRWADGHQIRSPVLEIPANSEILWCFFGRFEGADVGVVDVRMRSSAEGLMHHAVLHRVDDEKTPDGTLLDCTALEDQLGLGPPLFEIADTSTESWFDLPDGFAYKLAGGQRWAADVHYINLTDEPICINTAWDLELVDADEVDTFVAAYNLDLGNFSVPPGGEHTAEFECAWPQDLNLLSVSGHMHFYGSRYRVEDLALGQAVYEVDDWLTDYRFSSPITTFEPGEAAVEEGTVFRSSCTWNNTSDHALGYPEEMCTTFGIAYPLDEPLLCSDGEWVRTTGEPRDGKPPGSGDGTVVGTITRSSPPVEDGVGRIRIAAFDGPSTEPDARAVAYIDLIESDLSSEDASVDFTLTGVPLGIQVSLIVYLDDDDSGLNSGPTGGDLFGATGLFDVPTVDPVTIDVVLGSAP